MNKAKEHATKLHKIVAVKTVPRLGFQDHMDSNFEALGPLGIPLYGTPDPEPYWGRKLETLMMQHIEDGADAILTLDYDTVYKRQDVVDLIKLMETHPEATAIAPLQAGRGGNLPLLSMKSRTGQMVDRSPRETFLPEVTRIHSAHYALTLFRVADLIKIPHPWFRAQPDRDGQWGSSKVDADIWLWKLMEERNMILYSANRIVVGHLDLVLHWPDTTFGTLFQQVSEYKETGKPENVWR